MNRRIAFLFLVILNSCNSIFSQTNGGSLISKKDIVGVWQVNSNIISSTLKANFQFFTTGKFIYNISGYDELNPFYNISGFYRIENKILYLKINSFKALTKFKIVESNSGFQFGPFILDSGKVVTYVQKDIKYSEHQIEIINEKSIPFGKCIIIDSDKYYKLSNNPLEYSK